MAQDIINGLYPHYATSQSTVDRTDRYLREEQPGPALRRMLLEARDGLARALRAQQRDITRHGWPTRDVGGDRRRDLIDQARADQHDAELAVVQQRGVGEVLRADERATPCGVPASTASSLAWM